MSIIDVDAKLADIKAKIRNVNVGLNREEKTIIINALDKSTHIHYHNEIGLTDETILNLSSQEIGDLLKKRAYLNLKVAVTNSPEEMQKFMAKYNHVALVAGTTSLTATNITVTPMPSGDFVQQLPGAIDSVSVSDVARLEISEAEDNKDHRKP